MSGCQFGHAKTLIVSQHEQGACCDEKHWHFLQKGHLYHCDTPLTLVPDSVPRTYKPLTASDQEFCGLRTCETDAREWETDCEVSICTAARNLIAKTVSWPEGFTDDDVEILRAQKSCCFELVGAPCCHDPKLPDCPEEGEEKKEAA